MKYEGEVPVPLKHLLSYVQENISELLPFISESNTVKEVSKGVKVVYAVLDVPPPCSTKRECLFYTSAFNLIEETGTVAIVAKSIHDS